MINVMYHYVRNNSEEYPHFNNLDLETFSRQLDFFEKKYGFIKKSDYIEAIKNKQNIDGVVLSFDDGFKDHYVNVAKELNRRGLWGSFYIPTGIFNNNKKLLGVHRVHFLNGKYGATCILKYALSFVKENMLEKNKIREFDKEIYKHSSYQEDAKELRRLFNYYLKYEYRDLILDNLMSKYFNEKDLFESTYLSTSNIKEMNNKGHIIGSHTENHSVLSRLNYEEQKKEIESSLNYLMNICDEIDYKSFCYPYGYKSSYNQTTLKILDELGFHNAVIFDNETQGSIHDVYQLSRIDCNQFIEIL